MLLSNRGISVGFALAICFSASYTLAGSETIQALHAISQATKPAAAGEAAIDRAAQTFDYLFRHPHTSSSIALARAATQQISPQIIEKLSRLASEFEAAQKAAENDPYKKGLNLFWREKKASVAKILKQSLQGVKIKHSEENEGLRGFIFDVEYQGQPLRVSYFLGHREIKFAPDPGLDDIDVKGQLMVPATLLGVTFDFESRDVMFDRSKAHTILRRLSSDLDVFQDADADLINNTIARIGSRFEAYMIESQPNSTKRAKSVR